ncbi:MAG: ATP-binding protein [Acidobacteria bacterium]|nr:ATP-binding protein [Acidobacteriota bacterium]
MSTVFLSYRRDDSEDITGEIAHALTDALGSAQIFWDQSRNRDGLLPGQTWRARLDEEIGRASIVLAIIGANWPGDSEGHTRRIDTPDDVVRQELELALIHTTYVIPVLVDIQPTQWRGMLPDTLKALEGLQCSTVHTGTSRATDIARLTSLVSDWLGSASPSGLRSYLAGWLQFRRWRATLRAKRDEFLEANSAPRTTWARDLDIRQRPWDNRLKSFGSNRRRLLILGPPGVGKTTYALQYLKERHAHADVVLPLRGSDLLSIASDAKSVWRVLRIAASRAFPAAHVDRLSEDCLAYMLRRCHVVLYVDDLHLAGRPEEILRELTAALEMEALAGRLLSVVAIGRADLSPSLQDPPQGGESSEVRYLLPFTPADAQTFLWSLCLNNGLTREQLREDADNIEAFRKPALSVPLFVVICAWLAARKGVPLRRILGLHSGGLFNLFLSELIQRSVTRSAATEVDRAFEQYATLAHDVWPNSEFIVPASIEDRVDTDSWTTNGLLERSVASRFLRSFPHPLVPDYLIAERMTRSSDFEWIRSRVKHPAIAGMVPFLGELLKRDDMPRLLMLDLTLGLDVLDWREQHLDGGRQDPAHVVWTTEATWSWMQQPKTGRAVDAGTWKRVARLLKRGRGNEIRKLCEGLPTPTGPGIQGLAHLDDDDADAKIEQWLVDGTDQGVFAQAVDTREVQQALLRLAGKNGCDGRFGEQLLAVARDRRGGLAKWFTEWLKQQAPGLSSRDLAALANWCGRDVLVALAYAVRDEPQSVRVEFSRRTPVIDGHVLIPPGEYRFRDGRKPAVIEHAMLVPTKRKRFAQNMSLQQVRALVDKGRGVRPERLMREPERDVLTNFYSHVPFSEGTELFRTLDGRLSIFATTGSSIFGSDAIEVERPMFFREITYAAEP